VDQRRFLFKGAPTAVTAAAVSAWPHLASGTDVPRVETVVLDFIARQMELPRGHAAIGTSKHDWPTARLKRSAISFPMPLASYIATSFAK